MQELTARVLSALLSGETLSGQALAQKIGVSRAAVWKHVTALRELGYEIDSCAGTGYALTSYPDDLHEVIVHHFYKPDRLGENIIYLSQCGSTNTELRRQAEAGAKAGLVITTNQQTEGRGRRGRAWLAGTGEALLFSVLLRPTGSPSSLSGMTLVAGVAVAEALEILGFTPRLKWPNDVYLSDCKVAGILAEISGELDRTNYVILGIGINVWDHPKGDFNATSLRAHGSLRSRAEVLATILKRLEVNFALFASGQQAKCFTLWREKSMTLSRHIEVSTPTERFVGLALDIDADGALLVQQDNGQIRTVTFGDVTIR